MKVSDLVLELQLFYQDYGDLPVMVRPQGAAPQPLAREAVAKGHIVSSGPDEPICVVRATTRS